MPLRRGDATPEERKQGEDILATGGNAAFQQWMARATLQTLERAKGGEEMSSVRLASVYAEIGDKDRTFRYLEQAYKERSPHLPFIKVSRVWDPIRFDARFQDLLRRMRWTKLAVLAAGADSANVNCEKMASRRTGGRVRAGRAIICLP